MKLSSSDTVNGFARHFRQIAFLLLFSGAVPLFVNNALAQGAAVRGPAPLGDRPIMSELMGETGPNVLVIYDNSGSMSRASMPDTIDHQFGAVDYYLQFTDGAVNNYNGSYTSRATKELDTPNSLTSASRKIAIASKVARDVYTHPVNLIPGFNRLAYNPTVTYSPPQVVGGFANLPAWAKTIYGTDSTGGADVVTYPDMNKQNTNNWTRVPTTGSVNSNNEYWQDWPLGTSGNTVRITNLISTVPQYNCGPNYVGSSCTIAQRFVMPRGGQSNFYLEVSTSNNNTNSEYIRKLKRYFPNIDDPEIAELFTFYCNDSGNTFVDNNGDGKSRLAGLTWRGCQTMALPLHYYKSSVKWCKAENKAATSAIYNKTTRDPFFPGYSSPSNSTRHGFGDGKDCVADTDPKFTKKVYPYPYFHYPYGDHPSINKYDNTKFNPFIPVVLDLSDAGAGRTYEHHYLNDQGDLGIIKRTRDDEVTNYLNWFVYYSTRQYAVKTIASRVFKDVSPYMHMGFVRLNDISTSGSVSPSGPNLPLRQFHDNTEDKQRSTFYNRLFNAAYSGSTPTLQALIGARALFNKTNRGYGNWNTAPILFGCQRNSVLLITDGTWDNYSSSSSPAQGDFDEKLKNVLPENVKVYGANLAAGNPWPLPIRGTAQNPLKITMADVALYNWVTVLQPGIAKNSRGEYQVPPTISDPATWPHLNLDVIAYSVEGSLPAANQEETIKRIIAGSSSGGLDWPTIPGGKYEPEKADDTWHATINGFGRFFSSRTPEEFEGALRSWVHDSTMVSGTGANAAFQNVNIGGEPFAFVPSYAHGWSGDLKKVEIDLDTMEQKKSPEYVWSASEKLKEMLEPKPGIPEPWRTERKIYTLPYDGNTITNDLIEFKYPEPGDILKLSTYQLNTLGATIDTQKSMIAYLRGDSSNEGTGPGKYRQRTGPLGDIVNSEPVYVGRPYKPYDETKNAGYAAFKASHATRDGVVYVGANDGMLHAFDAKSGKELWAYIPTNFFRSAAQGGLAALASTSWQGELSDDLPQEYLDAWKCVEDLDEDSPSPLDKYGYCPGYGPVCPDSVRIPNEFGRCPGFEAADDVPAKNCDANKKDAWNNCPPIDLSGSGGGGGEMFFHRYYVDATPRVMDAVGGCDKEGKGCAWKTVLVSGLGKGGTSYFALDITDPHNPKSLWEFTDKNMGYTYGRAIIVKTKATKKNGQLKDKNGRLIDDGNWVAIMPSGYNNGTGKGQPKKGDGIARIHMVKLVNDGNDGLSDIDITELLTPDDIKVVAGHGTRAWPAGMGHIVGFVDYETDQTVRVVYGGDQRGMLWRFILESPPGSSDQDMKDWKGSKLGYHLRDNTSKHSWQPVSTEPTNAVDSQGRRWVFVGTGRLTSVADQRSTIKNTMYGYLDGTWDPVSGSAKDSTRNKYDFTNRNSNYMKDVNTGPPWGRVEPGYGSGNWAWAGGWFHDLPDGYHVIAAPDAFLGVLVYAATTYDDAAKDCDDDSAHSIIYIRDIDNAGLIATIPFEGAITGLRFVAHTTGAGKSKTTEVYLAVAGAKGNVRLRKVTKDIEKGGVKPKGEAKRNFMRIID
jgi:Tfp pilus tip-associated adhesin PilY1